MMAVDMAGHRPIWLCIPCIAQGGLPYDRLYLMHAITIINWPSTLFQCLNNIIITAAQPPCMPCKTCSLRNHARMQCNIVGTYNLQDCPSSRRKHRTPPKAFLQNSLQPPLPPHSSSTPKFNVGIQAGVSCVMRQRGVGIRRWVEEEGVYAVV